MAQWRIGCIVNGDGELPAIRKTQNDIFEIINIIIRLSIAVEGGHQRKNAGWHPEEYLGKIDEIEPVPQNRGPAERHQARPV